MSKGEKEKGEREVVGRGVAIGLGAAVAVLLVCLAAVVVYYSSILGGLQNQIEDLQNQIAQLEAESETLQAQIQDLQEESSVLRSQNTELQNEISTKESQIEDLQRQVDSLNSRISYLQNQIALRDSQILSLENQVNNLTEIINLEKYVVLVDHETVNQPPGSYVYWNFSVNYAGYINVTIHSSTTVNTYVRVIWSSHGVNYNEIIRVGISGTAFFPVLPGNIEVRVGNTNLLNGATEVVTITYHY